MGCQNRVFVKGAKVGMAQGRLGDIDLVIAAFIAGIDGGGRRRHVRCDFDIGDRLGKDIGRPTKARFDVTVAITGIKIGLTNASGTCAWPTLSR